MSPISHCREALSRLAEFFPTWQVFPDTSSASPESKEAHLRPAVSGREYAVNATV
jgi:hypothetical protein